LRVVDRGPLTGDRGKVFLALLEDKDPVVAQAALRLIASHPEIKSAGSLLVNALSSDIPGTQATAAQIIAAYPHRALDTAGDLKEQEALLQAIGTLLKDEQRPAETRAAAIKAAGSLQALSLKPLIETLCASQHQALWDPAEGALALLGATEPHCPPKAPLPPMPANDASKTKASSIDHSEVVLNIESDVGPLILRVNENAAPASRQQFLKLVDEGYYNGLSVHGARPGFALQFGDQDGDGYDAEATPGLPNEVTPTHFSALSFGMSAFSEGSQNSQIFVVVSDAPQLVGSRVRLGQAEGPWHLLMVGDTLHSVKRQPEVKK
jgi:peptidyl-prolyl cis-trans isomerase B (cyclophilin B)